MNYKKILKKLFKKYPNHKKYLVLFSGGLDSTVLLWLLIKSKKNLNLRALHINYNIHNHAKKSQKYCINFCKNYNIPLIIADISLKNTKKNGIEGSARIAKFKISEKIIKKNEILLSAHHMNDQCETFFLALKRKRGTDGLSCMKFSKKILNFNLVRPLLNFKKIDLLNIAKKEKIKWIEDISNKKNIYDRNFIRNIILKKINKKWPYFIKNLNTSINLINQENKIKNYILKKILKKNINIENNINILNLMKLKKNLQYEILRMWLKLKTSYEINYSLLNIIYIEFINNDKKNKKINFKKYQIRKYNFFLYCIHLKHFYNNKNIFFWHNINSKINLSNNLGTLKKDKKHGIEIEKPKKNVLINIRFQSSGKYKTKNSYINLKKIWQNYKIPPWLRNQIPLIFFDDILISVLGILSFFKKKKNDQKKIKICWYQKIHKKENNNKNKIFKINKLTKF